MKDLIRELQEKGFTTIEKLKLVGKARAVFDMLTVINYTKPYKYDQAEHPETRN